MVTRGMIWVVVAIIYGGAVAITGDGTVTMVGALLIALVAVTTPVWGKYIDQLNSR